MVTTKLYQKLLKAYCSKDETRQSIYQTVFHDDSLRAQVFTNGHCAAILPSHFDHDLSGKKIRLDNMKINERDFPKLSTVIPDLSKYQSELIKMDVTCGKNDRNRIIVFWNGERFTYEQNDKSVFAVNSYYLTPMLTYSVKVHWLDHSKPIVFTLDEIREDRVIIMPYKMESLN